MPGEFDIYSIRQFLPMTPEAYFRLFERLNDALWPFEVVAFIALIAVPILLRRGNGATAGVLCGLCWVWVAVVFQFRFHAELHWAGPYLGWVFIVQGLLLAVAGVRGWLEAVSGVRALIGLGLMVAAFVVYPIMAPLTGRYWQGVEIAGTAPDPTAVATLGVLLLARRVPWLLVPVPVLWCLYSGVTWWALGWLPGLFNIGVVLAFLVAITKGR